MSLKKLFKAIINGVSYVAVAPALLCCSIEKRIDPRRDRIFSSFAQLYAILPGFPGVCLRRAFYRGTIAECSWDCIIGFGVILSSRSCRIESNVYIGNYALIGDAYLRQGSLIGSRSSILSKGMMHERDQEGRWVTPDNPVVEQLSVGKFCWIGEAAVILADIGDGAMIAAGSVVAASVPDHVMVAGNPARFVKRYNAPYDNANISRVESPKDSVTP